jgi:hypothetical protein
MYWRGCRSGRKGRPRAGLFAFSHAIAETWRSGNQAAQASSGISFLGGNFLPRDIVIAGVGPTIHFSSPARIVGWQ